MKAIISILIMVVLCGISSCTVIGTLYPIYDNEKEYIIKKELAGKWMDNEDSSSYMFIDTTASGFNKLYKIYSIYIDRETGIEDTTRLLGHLVNSNGWYFLEYWYDLKKDLRDFMVVRHFVVKVTIHNKNEVELNFPDAEKLIGLIDQKKIQLTYAKEEFNSPDEDYYMILDKPPVLRRALAETKKYPKLYTTKVIFFRLQ